LPVAQRCGQPLDPELQEGGVIGGREPSPRAEVELQQARARLGMDGRELDPEPVHGANELVEEAIVAADLVQAVADTGRRRVSLGIPDPDLILDRGHHLVAQIFRVGEDPPEDLARCEVAR
jgi:hypothetical protein